MKFNWAVFKKGKAVYWVIGAIVLFVIFYLLASGGSKSSSSGASTNAGGVTTINSGPTDAQIAAAASISAAQIQANAQTNQSNADLAALKEQVAGQVAIATLQTQSQLADTAAGSDVAKYLASVQAGAQTFALTEQTRQMALQGEYSLETAKVAAETDLAGQALQAGVLVHQLDTNASMFNASIAANTAALKIQSDNITMQGLISQAGNLKKKDRDEYLEILAGTSLGGGVNYYNGPGAAVIYN